MSRKKITETVEEILSVYLFENGYELYNTEYVKEGKDWFLSVFIDKTPNDGSDDRKTSGISTDDCEKVSKYLSAELDRLDPIEHNYYLEVSSPGMDRELKKDSDFARFTGENVILKLYTAHQGSKTIKGILDGLDGGGIKIIDGQGVSIVVPREQVAKVKLELVF
jgi:ribosome maturation factor RimP